MTMTSKAIYGWTSRTTWCTIQHISGVTTPVLRGRQQTLDWRIWLCRYPFEEISWLGGRGQTRPDRFLTYLFISPPTKALLFNIFVADIPTFDTDRNTQIFQFADYTAILAKGTTRIYTFRRLENALEAINIYMMENTNQPQEDWDNDDGQKNTHKQHTISTNYKNTLQDSNRVPGHNPWPKAELHRTHSQKMQHCKK